MTTLAPQLALILTGLSIVNIIYTWWRTRDQNSAAAKAAIEDRFKDGSTRMDRHEVRLNSIEQTLRTLPEKDDMHLLQLELTRVLGEMKEMRAIMVRLEATVTRQEDHLLKS